jgi:hypothetical protein
MKRIRILVLGLMLILIISACSSGRIDSLEKRADECIVIAKVFIKNYNKDITRESTLSFDAIVWSLFDVKPDDSCYIYLKLPLGKHFHGRIEYIRGSINLPKRMLVFETPESKVYYLGHISTELSLETHLSLFAGIVGWITYESRDVEKPPVLV